MTSVESVVMTLAAGLLGGACGAALGVAACLRRRDAVQARQRLVDAHACWLAARLSLTRASGSLVAAFRAMAAEPRESAYFSLRCDEAQRARAQWCDATRELDRAESTLIAYRPTMPVAEELGRFRRVDAEALRLAIDGGDEEAERLMRALSESDREATAFVRSALGSGLATDASRFGRLASIGGRLEDILEQWSSRGGRS